MPDQLYRVRSFALPALHAHRVLRAGPGQQLVDRFGNDDAPFTPFKADHQADIAFGAQHAVPGQPDAVGRPQCGLAQVCLQLIGGEHELLFRALPVGIHLFRIEGVDRQRAVHFDRLRIRVAIKEHAPAKTANGRLVRLMQHGVCPERDDAFGRLEVVRLVLPRKTHLVEVQRRTAGQRQQGEAGQKRQHQTVLPARSDHRRTSSHELEVCGP
ncbi:MAG: hypothetical protein GXY58_07655 [Planctomycetaceae bacterium]|nr:hypothetical protein [Planctomycetaceae bacterium]